MPNPSFKPFFGFMTKPRLAIVLTPFVIAFLVTLITQYVVPIPVKNLFGLFWLGICGLALGLFLGFLVFRSHKSYRVYLAVAVLIGFCASPYFAFAFGRIHIFMKDDALPEYMEVLEVRPTLEKIVWVEETRGEIVVLQGPRTLILHPGEQRVHLGTMDIPAGFYVGGQVYIGGIEVDMKLDFSVMGVSPERYEEEYQVMQSEWFEEETINWRREDALVWYTIKPEPVVNDMLMDEGLSYMGFGGPDITLDIIIGNEGKPSSIIVLFDAPPGIPVPPVEVDVSDY